MPENVGFFTPIRYSGQKTFVQSFCECVDDYFYLGGKVAHVISGQLQNGSQGVQIEEAGQAHYLLCAIKVASFATLIIPTIIFFLKLAFRWNYPFHVIQKSLPADTPPPPTITPSSTFPNAPDTTVASLIAAWDKDFNFPNPFDVDRFTKLLNYHADRFEKKAINPEQHLGYIDKIDLAENTQIYMRADLHGDLKSLIENLRSLKNEGLLDENYRCKLDVHLQFLGDYCDRGPYGTQILEMLMRLREENPMQVHLIRGNHEYLLQNSMYGCSDERLRVVIRDSEASKALIRFYATMSLTTYVSIAGTESREYIQCTHGTFEPTMDPAPLLDQGVCGDHLPVPKERRFSARLEAIKTHHPDLLPAVTRIKEFSQLLACTTLEKDGQTLYNWGDIHSYRPGGYPLFQAELIHDYLSLSSEQHRVMMIFRGHEHEFQHVKYNDQVLVTTLPVGMDCPAYQNNYEQPDRAYILTTARRVGDWKKRAILREKEHLRTDEITAAHPLTSDAI
jgi:hypothetical protein